MKNQYEKRLAVIDKLLADHARDYKAVLDKAEEEDRQLTEDDRATIAEHMQGIETLKTEREEVEANRKQLEDVDKLQKDLGPAVSLAEREWARPNGDTDRHTPAEVKSLGDQFIESKGYKSLMERGLAGEWSSGSIDIDTKASLSSARMAVILSANHVECEFVASTLIPERR